MGKGEPIRLIHFSDLHLGIESYGPLDPQTGVSRRVKDFLDRLDDLVNYALESGADAVLFCGDAYKGRNPLPIYERELAYRIKKLSEAGIPVILVGGNHDLPENIRKASSLDIFVALKVPHVYVFRRPGVMRLETRRGAFQVAAMPYPPRALIRTLEEEKGEQEFLIEEEIQNLARQVDPEIPSVLAGHFGVIGARSGSEKMIILGEDFKVSKSALLAGPWDYVALGHIHCFQNLNPGEYPPIIYSGSLERVDFSEEKERKGFVEVFLMKGETSWNFIPVKARPFLTIEVDVRGEQEPEKALFNKLMAYREKAERAVVRVRVIMREWQKVNEEKVREILSNCYHLAKIEMEVERVPRWRLGSEAVESLDWKELLERHFKAKKLPREDIELLLKYAEKLFQEVEE
ncbi:MAG: exonuclease SbcCD subunit D [Anaerolineae bacterium]|nr:exonuclease SbcCD subunit D [Anaerolineae bacterium]MDW8103108.1 exonuclease SbcCD subunit D [Anaerolineae bacterium]